MFLGVLLGLLAGLDLAQDTASVVAHVQVVTVHVAEETVLRLFVGFDQTLRIGRISLSQGYRDRGL